MDTKNPVDPILLVSQYIFSGNAKFAFSILLLSQINLVG
jgi:hypothetical protein